MKYLLDTCVISELIAKSPNQKVIDWVDQLEEMQIYLSVVTIGEICKGIAKLTDSQRKNELTHWLHQELLARFADRILPIDVEVMLTWGELTGNLERTGKKMPAVDSLIAAIALQNQLHLVTRNEADFREAGIIVVNPWNQ
jgi:tRNA(fMet)-specific endonuclease VapC